MDQQDIWEFTLAELVQRSFRLMRETNPEADEAFKSHIEVAQRMDAFISRSGAEARELYSEFCNGLSVTHSYEVDHAYVQGARDCVFLLRTLGLF